MNKKELKVYEAPIAEVIETELEGALMDASIIDHGSHHFDARGIQLDDEIAE